MHVFHVVKVFKRVIEHDTFAETAITLMVSDLLVNVSVHKATIFTCILAPLAVKLITSQCANGGSGNCACI